MGARTWALDALRRLAGGTVAVAVALVLGSSVLVLGSSTASAGARQPVPGETGPGAAEPPSFTLVDRPPWIGPDDAVPFSVATSGDVAGVRVDVELWQSVDTVDEVQTSLDEDVGRLLFRSPRIPVEQLAPGADGTLVVAVKTSTGPSDAYTARLSRPGVYPLVLRFTDADGAVVDEIRTPLVRLGDDQTPLDAPTLAVLLDVDAPPTLRPDGSRQLTGSRLRELSAVGSVLAAHPDLDLTVAATPDTVEALGASTEPLATELIDRLRNREALALPYLPVAVRSLQETDLIGLVPPLLERGATVLTDRLGARLRNGIWDPPADLAGSDAELLGKLGYQSLLVPSAALDRTGDTGDTADTGDTGDAGSAALVDAGPVPLDGLDPLNGLVVDSGLSRDLAAPLGDRPDAAHVALAELLVRDDAGGTTTLVRPGPLADRSVLAGLLDLLDTDGSPVRVGGLGLLPGQPAEDASPRTWTGSPAPSLFDIADRVLNDVGRVDTFAAIIDPRSSRADDLHLQIATAVAATTSDARRNDAMTTVESTLDEVFGAIRLAGETDLNLTSREGTLPVTVANDNDFSVDVLIRVRSDRLRFPQGDVLSATVPSGGTRIDVPVEALATGSVPTFVELWTGDDVLKLDARQLNVRSTAITGVGVALSLGALLVLVVWWFRSWRRSRRERAVGDDGASVVE